MSNIVIINGNPDSESLCYTLHESYKKGALNAGNKVEEIKLSELKFDPNLKYGFRKRTELEPDMLDAWEKIKRANHIVWIYPTWWGMPPAIMKGFIDRLFLPNFAFEYQDNSPFPKKLLTGRTSEIITTMDTPIWYYKFIYKNIGVRMLKKNIGDFCGIKNTRTTYISPVKGSTPEKRKEWISQIEKLGSKK